MIPSSGNRPINRSKINRILIRATNWVGDVVMTLPALEAVRENFPKSMLAVLARPWVIPLLESHPAVDKILPLRKGNGPLSDLVEILRVAGHIRQERFDLAILFQNAFEAALIAYLGGIKYRVGYGKNGRRFLLSHPITQSNEIMKNHQVEYYLSILKRMGCEAKSKDPELFVSEKHQEKVRHILLKLGIEKDDFLLGLGPGAIFGPAKRWPPERFAAIGNMAAEKWGAKVLLFGSIGEMDICSKVAQGMKYPAIDLCGQTRLGEVMALIRKCRLFVSNDSGLMHVAAALNVPLVAIFGSTNPVTTGPRSPNARIVQHKVDCAPCLRPECPEDYRCLMSINPQEVWEALENLRIEIN